MSFRHQERFDAIKREHEQITKLLSALAVKGRKTRTGSKGTLSALPSFNSEIVEAAVATSGDAYALLLIASAEGFMRDYLDSIGIAIGDEPKLSMLIDRSRKEFNKANPTAKIHPVAAQEMHDLRLQRNRYAHGHSPINFPTIRLIVGVLGRFFKDIP